MLHPESPIDEMARLTVLTELRLLDGQPEPLLDDLARVAALLMGAPHAMISLVDRQRVWYKAKVGHDVVEIPREDSFCTWTIREPGTTMVVVDARLDARFQALPMVAGPEAVRFYAGAPLVSHPEGLPLGTLCVLGDQPLVPSASQIAGLQALARQVEDRLSQHRLRQAGDAQRIKAAEQGFRLALEGEDAGLWEWDVPTNRVTLSAGCRRLLGLPQGEDEAYRLWQAGVHPEDLAGIRLALNDLQTPGHDFFRADYRFLRPDGRQIWLQDRGGVTSRDGSGGAVQVVGVLVDATSQREALDELAESERRFRLLADQAPVLIWMSESEGERSFFNATWLAYTGRTLEQEIGTGWQDGIHPEDRLGCAATYREALGTRVTYQMEYRMRRADGVYRWLLDSGSPRVDSKGEFCGFMGSCVDIDDLQAARRRQQDSEARLLEAQAVARLGHWRLDLMTGAVEWSPEVYRIYGFDPLLGSPGFADLVARVHPDDMEDWQSYINDLRTTGGPAEIEHRIILPDGAIRTVNGRGTAQIGPDDMALSMYGTVQDISERAILAQETQRLLDIIERVPDFIHVASVEGAVIYANESLRNRCLPDAGVIDGLRSMGDYQPPEAALAMGTEILPEVDRLGRWTGITQWKDAHGEVFSTLQTIMSHRDRGGVLTHYSSIARDITEQLSNEAELRAAKEQAEAAARAKGGFLAIMSHELRTPLNGALGMLSLLARTPLTPEQRDHMDTARTCSQALLGLIDDILDYSKLDAGRVELERIPFRPREVVREALAMVTSRAEAAGLRLRTEVEPGLPERYLGDPTRIRQVLLNLIGNAVKFTPAGTVTVQLAALPGGLGFWVRDTGIGMDEVAQKRLFSPFSQADSTMTRRFGGTGLGLVITRQLVELMEGVIVVESVLGQGSTFSVQLPLESVVEPALPSTVVLLDPIIPRRALFARRLKAMGLKVLTSDSLEDPLDGVILMDAGEEHLDQAFDLRAAGRRLGVVIDTGETAPPGFIIIPRDGDDDALRTALLAL